MLFKNNSAMKKNILHLSLVFLSLMIIKTGYSERFIGAKKQANKYKQTTAGCAPASSYRFLDINNVRGRINTGGDMWWDLPGGVGAQYFIPKEGTATSLFSGSLWIGGLDINDQLKLAAVRYRQIGNDYWPGPLTVDGTAAVDEATCAKYDQHFLMTREMVDNYLAWWSSDNKAEDYPNYTIPEEILDWPAHGNEALNQSFYLAPFNDVDGDGRYDPYSGDYPYYDIDNSLCPLNRLLNPEDPPARTMEELYTDYKVRVHGSILSDQVIKGDQTLWWIFNDKGNFHSETEGAAIGLEIRAQAFAFSTNDEINNMTFYSYEIINRSTFELTNTFFSPWVDTDLGYAWDDYVGCDVNRGLGYCYNGNAVDGQGQPQAYGDQPPAIGVDFFQGPYLDPDGVDNPKFTGDCSIINSANPNDQMSINGVNFGNNIIDDERFGMRRFVYHNNAGGVQGDPRYAPQYYNYLRGFWKDNTHMLYGGNAHTNSGALGPECNFMFPGDSDPCNWGTEGIIPNGGFNQNGNYWTEEQVGNQPSDRRFMQSAGPFTLTSGAVNYITVGIPWARATTGGPWASVELLRTVDDKCQKLFENCFKVLDGPDAPNLTFIERDREFIVLITNSKTSNNYLEEYAEYDNRIPQPTDPDLPRNDSLYIFEGYLIYQLRDATVSVESLHDPDQARLVAQFDKKNGITTLINYYKNEKYDILEPVVEVVGGDNGISHSFQLTEDAFASGDNRLVNYKQYYYLAVAYAYNNYKNYDPEDPEFLDGQKEPFLAGRKNIGRDGKGSPYVAIPHKNLNGIVANSDYGEQPQITRIQGKGNGGLIIELTEATVEEILSKAPVGSIINGDTVEFGDPMYPIAYEPVYKIGSGPVNIKVVDPLNVKDANYQLKFRDIETPSSLDSTTIESARWRLTDLETGKTYNSDTTITIENEQLLIDLGLSVNIEQIPYPGDTFAVNYGLLDADLIYADSSRQWLSGVEDNNVPASPQNWIRSGTYQATGGNQDNNDWDMPGDPWDPFEYYEKIALGTWAPYGLCASNIQSEVAPATGKAGNVSKTNFKMEDLHSVDIVLTPDRSKWSRAVVLEMCPDPELAKPYPNGRPVEQFMIRSGQSVDKDGKPAPVGSGASDNPEDPNYISETGMSWFPGYAINIETGERLNIAFGEDSWLVGQNGRDMLFNPTNRDLDVDALEDPNMYNQVNGDVLFGGKHYVYVWSHTTVTGTWPVATFSFTSPAYDACKWAHTVIDTLNAEGAPSYYPEVGSLVFAAVMYVGMPMGVEGKEWLSNDASLKIRIGRPYTRYLSQKHPYGKIEPVNNYYPLYNFSTQGISTQDYVASKAQSDLDLINVVPNPYYAYSTYESNALVNTVKITNLPETCTVTIYNVKGTKIRHYTKDSPISYIDWDLKNFNGVPIAGGIYLIHVKSDDGERVIKWFGSLRIEDLNIF